MVSCAVCKQGLCMPYDHPQRSCGKVMFLHLSVILSTEGVWQILPWANAPLGRPPQRQTPPLGDIPPGTATAVDGTHPTGMQYLFTQISLVDLGGKALPESTSSWFLFLISRIFFFGLKYDWCALCASSDKKT